MKRRPKFKIHGLPSYGVVIVCNITRICRNKNAANYYRMANLTGYIIEIESTD